MCLLVQRGDHPYPLEVGLGDHFDIRASFLYAPDYLVAGGRVGSDGTKLVKVPVLRVPGRASYLRSSSNGRGSCVHPLGGFGAHLGPLIVKGKRRLAETRLVERGAKSPLGHAVDLLNFQLFRWMKECDYECEL